MSSAYEDENCEENVNTTTFFNFSYSIFREFSLQQSQMILGRLVLLGAIDFSLYLLYFVENPHFFSIPDHTSTCSKLTFKVEVQKIENELKPCKSYDPKIRWTAEKASYQNKLNKFNFLGKNKFQLKNGWFNTSQPRSSTQNWCRWFNGLTIKTSIDDEHVDAAAWYGRICEFKVWALIYRNSAFFLLLDQWWWSRET